MIHVHNAFKSNCFAFVVVAVVCITNTIRKCLKSTSSEKDVQSLNENIKKENNFYNVNTHTQSQIDDI